MSVEFLFFHMMKHDVNDVKAYSFNLMSLLNDDELSFVHSGFFPPLFMLICCFLILALSVIYKLLTVSFARTPRYKSQLFSSYA